MNID